MSLYIDVSVDVFDREQSTTLETDLGEVVLGTPDLMELKTRRKTVNVSSNTGGRRDEPVSLRRSEGVGRESKRNKKGRSMVAEERRRRRQALKPPASILKLRSGNSISVPESVFQTQIWELDAQLTHLTVSFWLFLQSSIISCFSMSSCYFLITIMCMVDYSFC